MREKYLITGATGFVGSYLTKILVGLGKDVSVIVRGKNLNWRLRYIANKISIYKADLAYDSLDEIIQQINPTHIYHLAAYGALSREDDFDKMIDVNFKGTRNILDSLDKCDYKIFVYTGSSSEYGIKEKPMRESDILAPVNEYGITKVAAELYAMHRWMITKKPIVSLRLFSPYGYYEEKSRLIPSVILNALDNKKILLSSPNNMRDFIFIEDTIRAYIAAEKLTKGEIYNVGSGKQSSVQDVVDVVINVTGSKSRVEWNKHLQQKRQVEPNKWEADIDKIKESSLWEPQYSLEQGISKTVEWFQNNRSLYD